MFRVSKTRVRNRPIVCVPMVPTNDVSCYADTVLKRKTLTSICAQAVSLVQVFVLYERL